MHVMHAVADVCSGAAGTVPTVTYAGSCTLLTPETLAQLQRHLLFPVGVNRSSYHLHFISSLLPCATTINLSQRPTCPNDRLGKTMGK